MQAAVKAAEASGGATSIPYRELGMAYSRAGKPRLAIDWLNKAVQVDLSDSDTHGIIGGVYKQDLEIEKAIEAYQRGFDSDPKSTYCLLNVVGLLLIRNQVGDKIRIKRLLPEADKLTQEAVNTEGADHWALFDRAHYLLYAAKSEDAVECFSRALQETKTIGELESARKNLDLLADFEVALVGLDEVINAFATRTQSLNK